MPDTVRSVSEIYGEIFGDDPLLLKELNQARFGSQILRNLLVDRAIATMLPTEVALNSDRSRKSFKKLARRPGKKPPVRIRKTYVRARLKRTKLSDRTVASLAPFTMVAKGEFTCERMEDVFADHDLARAELTTTASPMEGRLRIAAIGYRVSISRLPSGSLFNENLFPRRRADGNIQITNLPEKMGIQKLRRTQANPLGEYEAWVRAVTSHIAHALRRQSHVILLPEFSLPPNLSRRATDIEKKVKAICAHHTHSYFLFSGSRHEGTYNRGFILLRDRKKLSKLWWHYKFASARGLGENIMGPHGDQLPSYTFTLSSPHDKQPIYYRVLVAICYDVFDATTFINYVVHCADTGAKRFENVILVPSFNPSKDFVQTLRDLSFVANCPVIYVNGLHGDAKLFLYGFAVTDFMEEDIETGDTQDGGVDKADVVASPLKKLTTSVTVMKDNLRKEAVRVEGKYRALDPLVASNKASPRKEAAERYAAQLGTRLEDLDLRIRAIDEFSNGLQKLVGDGALRHLITIERCEDCGKDDHDGSDYCSNDVLYYNLDLSLVRLLRKFRQDYFVQDEFLPEPFRVGQRKQIRAMIQQRLEKRAKRR
jgi:predicted amidohydrolase